MPMTYRIAFWRKLVRSIVKVIFRLIFHLLARIRITGRENIPFGQPYVAAINHVSLFDPPFIVAFWPEMLELLGASDIWHKPGQDVLVRMYGGIPVHRGEFDRESIETVLAVLRAGRPLLIAPEGGRSHEPAMHAAKPGVAYILDEARVPVLPVGLVGTTDDFWKRASRGKRPLLEMHIGKPMLLPPLEGRGAERRDARQRNADLVMAHIAGLLPEEYQGVYRTNARPPAETGQ